METYNLHTAEHDRSGNLIALLTEEELIRLHRRAALKGDKETARMLTAAINKRGK